MRIYQIFPKNRSNVAASILSNPELLTSVYEETLTKSQGSVTKEMESQLQSIESHLNTLKNTWDKLWVNENNREVINLFIDFGTHILETIDKIGILRASIIGLVAGIGIKKMATGGGRAKSLPSKYATESFSREVCEININVHWYANI